MSPYNIDGNLSNSDWTKTKWDLPYDEEEFKAWFATTGMTVAEFKRLPVYKANRRKIPWLLEWGFEPIPDFKPGTLAGLMDEQDTKRKPQK